MSDPRENLQAIHGLRPARLMFMTLESKPYYSSYLKRDHHLLDRLDEYTIR